MKWNRDEVVALLCANVEEIEEEPAMEGPRPIILHFADSIMRYELWLIEATNCIFLAADPQRPVQGLPFFEISLPCTELAPYERGGMPTGLGIYSGEAVIFTITRRDDGNISLSGSYEGLTRLASTPPTDATS